MFRPEGQGPTNEYLNEQARARKSLEEKLKRLVENHPEIKEAIEEHEAELEEVGIETQDTSSDKNTGDLVEGYTTFNAKRRQR
jgi:septal ring factor EnvC (AmiA/AmiB activator)